jgi:hypothetical protein
MRPSRHHCGIAYVSAHPTAPGCDSLAWTTMNVYTQAVSEQKPSAHSSIVRIVLA